LIAIRKGSRGSYPSRLPAPHARQITLNQGRALGIGLHYFRRNKADLFWSRFALGHAQ